MPPITPGAEEKLEQYIVQITIGTHEDSANACMVFYILTDEPRTPLEIATIFRECIKIACNEHNEYRYNSKLTPQEYFKEIFSGQSHEYEPEAYDTLESNGFCHIPNKRFPITRWISLSGMDKWLAEDPGQAEWLFKPENYHPNGQVSLELFNMIEFIKENEAKHPHHLDSNPQAPKP